MLFLLDATHLLHDIGQAVRTTAPLELAGVLTGVACVWLAARSVIWNFPVAIVSCGLYIVVFVQARLYSDAGLQLAFIGLAAYGWWAWLRRQRPPATPGPHPEAELTELPAAAPLPMPLPITRTPARQWALLAAAGATYALGAGYLFARYTNAALPYYDSTTTSVSLVAQFQLSRRQLDNWLLWIAVDVVYVGLYWSRGLALTSLLYAVYLALAAYGYYQWRQEQRPQRPRLGAAAR
ncbi:MAG: nicotinamide riboside transporter PnuC [Janthinobacterium lividum]